MLLNKTKRRNLSGWSHPAEVQYLFFVPNNFEKYVITRQLLGRKDNCGFCGNEYIYDLEEAIKKFKKD